jgi:hypothetical protein
MNNLPQDTPRSYKEINVIYSMNPPKVQTLETMALIDFKKVVEASTSYLEIVEGLRTENERLTEENKVLTKRRKELNESKKLFGKKKRKKEITNISNQLLENNLKISNNLEKIKKEMAEQETRNYRLDEGIVIKFDGNKAALIMNDFYEQNCSMFSNEVMESKKRIYEATQTPSTQDASEEEKKAIKQ